MNRGVIAKILSDFLGISDPDFRFHNVGGGCINHALKITAQDGEFFLKWNQHGRDMFEAESYGLSLLLDSHTIRVPQVLGHGSLDGMSFLLLEYIESSPANHAYWNLFGQKLAKLHQCTGEFFGLDQNNYIGSLQQYNQPHDSWIDFFINQRLLPQIKLGRNDNLIDHALVNEFESLFSQLESLLPEVSPSLIHGDLWSGNIISGPDQEPYVIDPAVYYGNREIEIAFTQLFGGFDREFYEAYQEAFPLPPGFDTRVDIYNLYPLLVHVNLFGTSYLSGIRYTLKRFT